MADCCWWIDSNLKSIHSVSHPRMRMHSQLINEKCGNSLNQSNQLRFSLLIDWNLIEDIQSNSRNQKQTTANWLIRLNCQHFYEIAEFPFVFLFSIEFSRQNGTQFKKTIRQFWRRQLNAPLAVWNLELSSSFLKCFRYWFLIYWLRLIGWNQTNQANEINN